MSGSVGEPANSGGADHRFRNLLNSTLVLIRPQVRFRPEAVVRFGRFPVPLLNEAMVTEAGLSRNYAGIHYKFDCEAGQVLGRNVANYVLSVAPGPNSPVPLD